MTKIEKRMIDDPPFRRSSASAQCPDRSELSHTLISLPPSFPSFTTHLDALLATFQPLYNLYVHNHQVRNSHDGRGIVKLTCQRNWLCSTAIIEVSGGFQPDRVFAIRERFWTSLLLEKMRRALLVFIIINVLIIAFLVRSVFTLLTLLIEDGAADAIHRGELPAPNSPLFDHPRLIPKILHQTYKNESIPERWKEPHQQCQNLHAEDYEYKVGSMACRRRLCTVADMSIIVMD